MSISDKFPNPVYTGEKKYLNQRDGYSIWYPSNWRFIEMTGDHQGIIVAPFEEHFDTCIAIEKKILPVKVVRGDASVLKKGLKDGLEALPGIEIDEFKENMTDLMLVYDIKYSFLEGENRRKRWLRNIYWGEGQLIVIAQGASVKDFDYWMPVFFNTLMTIDLTGTGL